VQLSAAILNGNLAHALPQATRRDARDWLLAGPALGRALSAPVALSRYSQIFGLPFFLSCFNTPIVPKCAAMASSVMPGGRPATYIISTSGTVKLRVSGLYAMAAAQRCARRGRGYSSSLECGAH